VGPIQQDHVEDQIGYFDLWRGDESAAERDDEDDDSVMHLYTSNENPR
jgi:hypothetical protein